MIIWGINANNHDASISVIDAGSSEILFAGHAERYSRIKNDFDLHHNLVFDALCHGKPQHLVWFENPWLRRARYLKAGQYDRLFEQFPKSYLAPHLDRYGIKAPLLYSNHHKAHAAGGYFTGPYHDAAVVVIDAIGELITASIWEARGGSLTKKWQLKYPHSIGLFYSAITEAVGLKPNEEEYILMGMAAYGRPAHAAELGLILQQELLHFGMVKDSDRWLKFQTNLHKGLPYSKPLEKHLIVHGEQGKYDLALAAQSAVERMIDIVMGKASELVDSDNLVYSGGVALNCVANSNILHKHYDNVWIMPNPGDAGNSLGAAAAVLGEHLHWRGPFLGSNIAGPLDAHKIVDHLLEHGVCGVANGRAEFGPRALGNRSLLADPRRPNIKDEVNHIKQRQKFRPFAPAVLASHAAAYFEFPPSTTESPYMQYIAKVRDPGSLPGINHVDNTARVQTVTEAEAPNLHEILRVWHARTGCPILLNTSLNIKGEPLVNTHADAVRWEQKYGVKVF